MTGTAILSQPLKTGNNAESTPGSIPFPSILNADYPISDVDGMSVALKVKVYGGSAPDFVCTERAGHPTSITTIVNPGLTATKWHPHSMFTMILM